jgi:hypothetical protein
MISILSLRGTPHSVIRFYRLRQWLILVAVAREPEYAKVDGDGEAHQQAGQSVKPILLDLAVGEGEIPKQKAGDETYVANGEEVTGSRIVLAIRYAHFLSP